MNKILLGVTLGAVLGAIDGATAWFTPEVRPAIVGIIIGGAIKSIVAGAVIGAFARKVNSLGACLMFGLIVGALLAFIVAQLQHAHYLAIIVPGSIVGLILGFVTQRYGAAPVAAS
jgi:cation transporter-like permease